MKAYYKKNGNYPKEIKNLIPDYLSNIPSQEIMIYESIQGNGVYINYATSWPAVGATMCSKGVEERTWKCGGYL